MPLLIALIAILLNHPSAAFVDGWATRSVPLTTEAGFVGAVWACDPVDAALDPINDELTQEQCYAGLVGSDPENDGTVTYRLETGP
jgi:hypothetical protein